MNEPAWDPIWGPRRIPKPKPIRRRIKRAVATVRSLGRSPNDPARGMVILAYHGTGEVGSPWWMDFKGQMSLIEDLGYDVVSLSGLVESLAREELPSAPTLAITFDDGFANNLDVAYPELARRNWPATVFLATSYLGRRPYILLDEVPRLAEFGIVAANHTHGHAVLTQIDQGRIVEEIAECNRRIQDLTGAVPEHFCYPNGCYSPAIRDVIATTGLSSACSGRVGRNAPGQDPYVLRRLTLERGEGPRELRSRLAGGYDFQDVSQRHMDR